MQFWQHVKSLSSRSLPGTAFGLACTLLQSWNAVLSIKGEKPLSRSCVILWKMLSLTFFFELRKKHHRHFSDMSFVCLCVGGVRTVVLESEEEYFASQHNSPKICQIAMTRQWKRNSGRVAEAVSCWQPQLRKLPTSQQVEQKASSFLQLRGQKSKGSNLTHWIDQRWPKREAN